MPTLLNSAVQLKGTTGTNSYFITLSGAQPNLGITPSTGTGFTLVTGEKGQLSFTSTLGFVKFENSIIQTSVPNGDLTLQSTGTGRLNLSGSVYINGQSIDTLLGNFQDFTATNVTVLGKTLFSSATNTTTFLTNVEIIPTSGTVTIDSANTGSIDNVTIGLGTPNIGKFTDLIATLGSFTTVISTSGSFESVFSKQFNGDNLNVTTATIYDSFSVFGDVSITPVDQDVYITPTLNGTVYINPARTGYMDNMIIGANIPEAAYFTNVITDTLTLSQELSITTTSFANLVVTHLTVTDALITTLSVTGTSVLSAVTATTINANDINVANLTATGTTILSTLTVQNSVHAGEIYDNGDRVITNVVTNVGPGLTATTVLNGATATIALTNTGVVSLTAGTDTAISSQTGNITIWNTSTLQSVTDRGASTDNIIAITTTTPSTTSTDGALHVAGGVGVGGDIHVAGDVYSNGGSPYYDRLLYTPRVTVSLTAPENPRVGDFWIDPSVGVEFQLIPNGTGTVWVQFIGF